MSYVLGLDLGTSSLKGLLVDQVGQVIASASADYPLIHLKSGYSEQNPQEWLDACVKIFEKLSLEVADFQARLEGISFSGQMHGLVLVDADGKVLRNAILWNDVRNSAECERINTDFGDKILNITQNIAREGFTLPKILWVQAHEPELWSQVDQILLPKDYLRYWLTGHYQMDYSDAAGTLILDVRAKKWSEEVLAEYHIAETVLPSLVASTGNVGAVKADLRTSFGFENEVQVFAGGADNAVAAVGSGILDNTTGMVSIGTSGVFLSYEADASVDYQGQLHLFNHAADDAYYSMGVTLAAGHSLTWFKNTFAAGMSFDDLLANIDQIEPGSKGLLFAPYIVGERTPYSDGKIRGSFIGIDTTHTLDHFARAVLEGITFSLKDSQHLMETVAHKRFEKIVSVGGGSKNQNWLQIQADIFNTPITTLVADEGPGMGAAMLAAVGLGWYESMLDCNKAFVEYGATTQPIAENVAKYRKLYAEYRKIYDATKDISHGLIDIVNE